MANSRVLGDLDIMSEETHVKMSIVSPFRKKEVYCNSVLACSQSRNGRRGNLRQLLVELTIPLLH